MSRQVIDVGRRWYAIHTYSGYEENVSRNLKQRIESMDMGDKIFNVLIPTEKKIRIKNGKRRIIEEKIFPGYVLVEMMVTDDSWYVVRNTPNVTGFIGAGTTPTPISEEEMKALQKRMGVEEPKYQIDVTPGTAIKIIDGPFKDFEGKVAEVDEARGKIKALVSMFGRETPVELDSLQIHKL
ncbi:MAG: transcription termination/antitermination protein NusG [Candidatus Kerfeldbacteria bacterium]|nr:transcription termination/antitermination protein NusG [Candidatus Kerfeldbacteria bacterium]